MSNMSKQGRVARQRLATNENDENGGSTRMTRAKAAALGGDEAALPTKGLQTKKAAANTQTRPLARTRAALGDVSNFTKVDVVEGKKPAVKGAAVLGPKTGNGVQKRAPVVKGTRAPLGAKAPANVNKKPAGTETMPQKRKIAPVAPTLKDEDSENLGEPVGKKMRSAEREKAREKSFEEELKAENEEIQVYAPGPPMEMPESAKALELEDVDDPLMVAEYAPEIFEYLRDLEVQSIPNPNYMNHQDDLEWETRGILVDWLIEVHTRFRLLPETLFLAVNVIDRFLSEKVVQLNRLQLVGITAMFIASKYEEVLSPHVANFRHVADDGFSESEILSAERFLLTTLDYNLSYPNPMNFLRRISKADNYDIQTRTVGKYLMEISLLDHRFMEFRPSHVAAGAMYLARVILDRGEWDETLSYYAGYTEEEILPVFNLMVDYLARPSVHEAFFKKYASKKFLKGKFLLHVHLSLGKKRKKYTDNSLASILVCEWAKMNAAYYGITDTKLSLYEIS